MATSVLVIVTILDAKLKAELQWLIQQAVLMAQVMLLWLLAFPLSELCRQKGIFIVLSLPLFCEGEKGKATIKNMELLNNP